MSFQIPGIVHDRTTVTGITFAATQVPSTGANTLDDYEEGTWTPVIGGAGGTSGQTYERQQGVYVKIGKWVIAQCRVTLTAKGTITGAVQLQGLPFAANSDADRGHVDNGFFQNMTTATDHITGFVAASASAAAMYLTPTGGAFVAMVTGDVSNSTDWICMVVYMAQS